MGRSVNPFSRHERLMRRALGLARRARGRTWPNPMVGALVVRGGRVVGEGFHRRAGLPHAEIEALRHAGRAARGADLYCTLEPCHLHGRTGPCHQAIAAAGIRRVFVGAQDPNPRECGRGIRALRRLGIEVRCGILETECHRLNEVFEVLIRERRPWVVVKAATSLDGRLAPAGGRAQRLTGDACQRRVHRLRAAVDAVLVGAGTIHCDDPRLDVRRARGRNPAVVVLDGRLSCSPRARVFRLRRGAPVFVYATRRASVARQRALERAGAQVIRLPARAGRLPLSGVLSDLLSRGVYRLLVEGGADVLGQFLSSGMVDRLELHLAPLLLGSAAVPLARFTGPRNVKRALRLWRVEWRRLGEDGVCAGALRAKGFACSPGSSKTSGR